MPEHFSEMHNFKHCDDKTRISARRILTIHMIIDMIPIIQLELIHSILMVVSDQHNVGYGGPLALLDFGNSHSAFSSEPFL